MNVFDKVTEPVSGRLTDEFRAWGKTERVDKFHMVVTEKIDGTNAQVVIDDGVVRAGSRTKWITPEQDNYGFARWVKEHEVELLKLGRGRHYGEWWGLGIQRRYRQDRKRFSLFNTSRPKETLPECCDQVPVIYQGAFDHMQLAACEDFLLKNGSVAAPGFMQPEGYCVFIPLTGHIFKNPFNK